MIRWYTLGGDDGRTPVQAKDVFAFEILTDSERRVARDVAGSSEVSTVFLGLDHNYSSHGPPLLFETLVMSGPLKHAMERTSTWAEAERAHVRMLARVIASESPS